LTTLYIKNLTKHASLKVEPNQTDAEEPIPEIFSLYFGLSNTLDNNSRVLQKTVHEL